MFLFQSCKKSTVLFGQSIGQQALISGISDVIAVKYPNGFYKSTPFLACFGSHAILNRQSYVKIQINDKATVKTKNKVNRHGYMNQVHMTQEEMRKMDLKIGRNKLRYILDQGQYIEAQLYLLKITDKVLISDFDGTLTINDFGGLLGGIFDYNFMHAGYDKLMQKLQEKGVHLIWVTMRSLPFYGCSKRYLHKYAKVNGILLMQPEQFLPAVKKQLFKKTGNIKANMIKKIAQLFPLGVQPFVGGLGNRQGDGVAYLNIGIKLQNIYLVSSQSYVQRMDSTDYGLTYEKMSEDVDEYFSIGSRFY